MGRSVGARVSFGIAVGWWVGSLAMQDFQQLIVSNPHVMMGKPTIGGTRITVESILEKLAAGETIEQILDAHPRLTEDGIRAALAFAANALRADVTYPLEPAAR